MKIRCILLIVFLCFLLYLLKINLCDHEVYSSYLENTMNNYVSLDEGIRGRILDSKGNVLVDNVATLNVVYHNVVNISTRELESIANSLKEYVIDYYVSDIDKKNYYLVTHNNGKDLITLDEYKLYDERKLSLDDLLSIKYERITSEDISYSVEEEKIIYLFMKMQSGYIYQDKYLFNDVTEEVAGKIMELGLPGISIKMKSKRVYPYGEVLKDIFGSVGSIQKEDKDVYLSNGYAISDKVGISGLEKTYESILKGSKATYKVNNDNTLELVSSSVSGDDLVLSLDMDLELSLINTLKEELVKAKTKKQSKYFHDAYSIIGEPSTGKILAIAGVRLNDDNTFSDITLTNLSNSFTMGSVVKGASNTVGYLTGAISVGKKILDSCVKLHFQPTKCSYKKLGYVDDITALKTSSNYYQFITAIKSTGNTYKYNMDFDVTNTDFLKYRDTFAEFGLGVKTGIDLPNEQVGIIGSKISGDLLLNLAIGQYDTYTPVELFQYINTIANKGKRLSISLGNKDNTLLNEIALEESYFDRIIEGMYQVFHGGTASTYANYKLNVAGKTGTSETFYDSDFDGVVDTTTINSTVAFFYPKDEPKYSMIVVAPHVTDSDTYTYPFTKNVSLKMTNYLENFKH